MKGNLAFTVLSGWLYIVVQSCVVEVALLSLPKAAKSQDDNFVKTHFELLGSC